MSRPVPLRAVAVIIAIASLPTAARADAPPATAPGTAPNRQLGLSGGVHALGLGYGSVPYAITGHYQRGTDRIFVFRASWVKAPDAFDFAGPSFDLGGGVRYAFGNTSEVALTFGASAFFGFDNDGGAAGGIGAFIALRATVWLSDGFGVTASATGRALAEAPGDHLLGSLDAGLVVAY